MEYRKEEILDVISPAILGVVKGKYAKPFHRLFRFKNNRLYVQTNKVLAEFNFPSELDCFVDANMFKSVIGNAKPRQTIYIEQADRKLKISFGTYSIKLNIFSKPSGYSFPKEDLDEVPDEFPNGLLEAFYKVVSSASNDVTYQILTGVHLSNGGVIASDRTRITAASVPDLELREGVTITKEAILMMMAIGKPDTISIKSNKVEFGYTGNSVVSRIISPTIDGKYPQEALDLYNMPIDNRVTIEIPRDIEDSIKRVVLTMSEKIPYVNLKSKGDGVLTISTFNEEVGNSKEELEINSNEEFDFNISPAFLLDALANSNKLYYKTGESPLVFKNEDFVSIIAPVVETE